MIWTGKEERQETLIVVDTTPSLVVFTIKIPFHYGRKFDV